MRICLIAEGSYPYVMGGVSSWIQMLVNSMPQHEFIIYSIGAKEELRGIFKYEIPKNIVEIHENFLDEYMSIKGEWGKSFHIDISEREAIKNLICGKDIDWNVIFDMVKENKYDNVTNFLMSRDFFEIVEESSEESFTHVPFTEFFWTVKSMVLPLLQIIKKDLPDADLYHSVSTGYAGVIGALAKYKEGKPFLLTEHGIYSREREEEIIKADWLKGYFKDMWIDFFHNLSKLAYKEADHVVSLFNRNREIQIELGCDETKIQIIPNGVNVDAFNDIMDSERKDGNINIGALVRIVPIKDIKTMIHAFSIAKEELGNIRLYLMGPNDEDEEYFNECKQMVEGLNLTDVIFTGRVDPHDYLGRMDLLLLTSISEGQPFAVLEGMACKKPSITTDVGSCKELIEGTDDNIGDAGIVVPVMDYEKLGKAIVKLSKDESLRIKMGEAGRRRVESRYTIDGFIDSYKKLYKDMR